MMEQLGINGMDVAVVFIILINAIISYFRGFIKSIFKFVSLIVVIVLTRQMYPVVSQMIKNTTNLFEHLKEQIANALNLDSNVILNSNTEELRFIDNLPLPLQIKDVLAINKNPEVYNALNADSLKEYISGFIANICINILSLVILFVVLMIVMKILENILDLVAKLPVIYSINKFFGLIFGIATGIITVWILFSIIAFFLMSQGGEGAEIVQQIESSYLAKYFYNNNLIMEIILKTLIN